MGFLFRLRIHSLSILLSLLKNVFSIYIILVAVVKPTITSAHTNSIDDTAASAHLSNIESFIEVKRKAESRVSDVHGESKNIVENLCIF